MVMVKKSVRYTRKKACLRFILHCYQARAMTSEFSRGVRRGNWGVIQGEELVIHLAFARFFKIIDCVRYLLFSGLWSLVN